MSRSANDLGLAKRRSVQFRGRELFRTPLVVPSFSSKGFPKVSDLLVASAEVITDTVLVSAYDVYYEYVPDTIRFPAYLFLDSGGYECGKDVEFSDLGLVPQDIKQWSLEQYKEVLDGWNTVTPTVSISYDHPTRRVPITRQIDDATAIFDGRDVVRELLVKPTTRRKYLDIKSINRNARAFGAFDVLGLTEKELGGSPLERMLNIARARRALDRAGLDMPIHVFGSLDTVCTPLYFLAGADIFDGLTWLRFAYRDGLTIYRRNFAALEFEPTVTDQKADDQMLVKNYFELQRLQSAMRRFLNGYTYTELGTHQKIFQKLCSDLQAELTG